MSSGDASSSGSTGSFAGLRGDEGEAEAEPKDEALQALQDELAALKDSRGEERFLWIVVCVILVDVLWFRDAENAVVPVIVLLLEVLVLFILAKRMGIEETRAILGRMMDGISRTSTGGGN